MESSSSLQVPKLSESNFHSWKQRIMFVLAIKELDEYIEDDPPARDDPDYKKWIRNDRKAQAFIGLTLGEDHLAHVRDVKTAKEMFQSIKDLFERVTLFNKIVARRKFYTATMAEGEKIMTYINRVKTLAATLKSMGVDIDDQEIAMTVLCGLPPRFDNLISALDALGDDPELFTLDFIKGRLLQEEQRSEIRIEELEIKSESSALVATRRDGTPFVTSCAFCKKPGHIVSRCWKKYPHLRPGYKDTAAAAVDHSKDKDSSSDSDEILLMVTGKGAQSKNSPLTWAIDSGCTSHMTFDSSVFVTYKPVSFKTVTVGNSQCLRVMGMGDVVVRINVDGTVRKCKLTDVLHVPELGFSLLSVAKMEQKGLDVHFKKGRCNIMSYNKLFATGTRTKNLYVLDVAPEYVPSEVACVANLQLWHERLAHVHPKSIVKMVNHGVVSGVTISDKQCADNCEGCIYGKSTRTVIPKKSDTRAEAILDLVHSDVSGPVEIPSLGGSRYFITFIDDHSNWTTVYPMRRKSESLKMFKRFHKYAETQTGHKIKLLNVRKFKSDGPGSSKDVQLRAIRTDNGGEYISNNFKSYLESHGIHHQLTVAYTPQQNGVAERMNRTLMDLVRCMLHSKSVPKTFWAEALSTAVYVRNRVVSRSLPSNTTPHHIWMGEAPDLKNVRVFGSKCWFVLPKKDVKKLDCRAREGMFVGYSENSKGYKIWDATRKSMVVSRDVRFDEVGDSDNDKNRDVETAELHSCESDDGDGEESESDDSEHDQPDAQVPQSAETSSSDNTESAVHPNQSSEQPPIEPQPILRRSSRVSRPPGQFWIATSRHNTNPSTAFIATELPQSYAQAMQSDDADFWKPGFDREMDALRRNRTWNLVPRKNGMNVLKGKWVFKVKNGKSKMRWVAKGCQQVHGVDYGETYAPVVKFTSIRALLSMVAALDFELHQMDVVTAFLYGDIDEDIYVEQPPGFVDANYPDHVCKLKKALYGLKQSPRMWHAKIDDFLVNKLGFETSTSDPCLYVRRKDGKVLIIALYVDDLLIAGDDKSGIAWIKGELSKRFEMKDLGEAKTCLGLEITRDRANRTLKLSQSAYAADVLERFGMTQCKPVATPMEPRRKNTLPNDPSQEPAGDVPYRSAIGCLMFLMVGTRPDIGDAVGKLSQHSEQPLVEHWIAVKRVLRYIAGTKDVGIVYGHSQDITPYGYTDSDWAGDTKSRKSTSGYVFIMAGGPVSWRSKKQTVIALSSCEAEYIASCYATKEAIWLKRLFNDMTGSDIKSSKSPVTLLIDNQGAADTAYNHGVNDRNKHIDIQYHFVREAVECGKVSFKYCRTEDMVADILTKPLERVKFQKFVSKLNLS